MNSVGAEGLSGCRHFEVSVDYEKIKVVRCPNSSTTSTYQSGKSVATITTVDMNQVAAEEQLIKEQIAEVERLKAKDALLQRLTPDEKRILGVTQ